MTFLVNDVLKHEVILLGNAEAPKKKKVTSFNHSVIFSKKIIICKSYFGDNLDASDIHNVPP